ncbi:Myo-inositol transporter-like protein 1 [Elsinoe australis]|uniref:Myo-inositol transporter-like protein 1 n=1 Tax=Elsinoe australis TaxID=40998 RepID=A0A4U7AZ57_9PEZI|nr:Myo-inositol transporter-like protein 1 [Elsinoe australis]
MTSVEKDMSLEKSTFEHVERTNTDLDKNIEVNLDTIEDSPPGPFVWMCAAATAIGGMLFGYDTGVISGVLVVLGSDLDNRPVTDTEKELITALCAAGALIGAIIAGVTGDRYGRKPAIWFASVLFTIGAVVQATSYTIIQMCVGRFLIGLGVGSASMIVPLYIAEISPSKFRGRMISIDMIFLGTGSVLAYAFDAAFYRVPSGWRYMVGLGGIPSIVLGVFLFFCPESPRQLMFHNKEEECTNVIRKIYPQATEEQVAQKVLSITMGVNQAKSLNEEISIRKSLSMMVRIPANLRAAIAACGLMAFQQFCGFNTLMYYSSTLFSIVGFSNPIAVGTIVAVVNWVFTVVSIFIIDRVGRRRILLYSTWGMPVPIDRATLTVTSTEIGWPAYLVLVMMIGFVGFYAVGLGCVPWQANEFLPMEIRAMGTTMINVFNWGPNIIVSSTFLRMMRGISPSGTFGFYAGLCVVGCIFVYFCFPEASNMTLEEVRKVFEHGFGVKYAEEWRKDFRQREKARKAGIV